MFFFRLKVELEDAKQLVSELRGAVVQKENINKIATNSTTVGRNNNNNKYKNTNNNYNHSKSRGRGVVVLT